MFSKEHRRGSGRKFKRSTATVISAVILAGAGYFTNGFRNFDIHPSGPEGQPPSAGASPFGEGEQCFPAKDQTRTSADFAIPVGNNVVTVGFGRSVSGNWYRRDNPQGTNYPVADNGTIPNIDVPGVGGKLTLVFDAANGRDELCQQIK